MTKGASPNPANNDLGPGGMSGRLARQILDRANDSVTYVRLTGRRSVITRFEAVLIELANGQVKGRRAKTAFVNLVLDAAHQLEKIDRTEILTGAAVREAAESGSLERFQFEHDRFLNALPKIHELSNAELIREYKRMQRAGYLD